MGLNVKISGVGYSLPDKILTNRDLEKMVETSDEWITQRTGIKERRIAREDQPTSYFATEAAKKALSYAGLSPEELDLIILGTVTPDMSFPSTACIVQKNIGAKKAAAFDIQAACTGFIYGLAVGAQFIHNGVYKNVLVIGAETLSKITDYTDRNTCVLFGDGAGAVVLSPSSEEGIISVHLGADGRGGDLLSRPAGGSLKPITLENISSGEQYIKMAGQEVFKFAVKIINETSKECLEKGNLTNKDIDFFIPHQANIRIIESAVKRLEIPKEKVYVNLEKYGNMSAASIPVALGEVVEKGLIKKGDKVLMVGFGGGLTWGGIIIKW
ncbi:3-oxoacyl-[acyl-carrier-protein] synthase III [Anaerobranca californiensis DSM 14826]|jgi:3-oxoacyl-[acyl-carrier-protein] synthase-3|uniref:Beta-ketoacyl-[acyl-carrier-protein] synthase III n=1 Tax=Anaerobranca californiensis DSM 14826 TaxID=1120989 RepID=A0A1M6MH75_9FIRM|nr:beta-ketoacyl-ACP synthase III [Anaerobranca californiensis]SHJ82798.1 3-oxoacyl-[acyl-carrier-protein] synthase III [Anaerobranca californiensis DSM 14826]